MPAEPENVIHQLAVGGDAAVAEIVERARHQRRRDHPGRRRPLRAGRPRDSWPGPRPSAATTRDRQLVAIAAAHLAGDAGRVEDLARDHLADHPDSVLVAWITAAHPSTPTTRKDPS